MNYRTTRDLKKHVEEIIKEDNYHVIITRVDKNEIISDCYYRNISTDTVIENLKAKEGVNETL